MTKETAEISRIKEEIHRREVLLSGIVSRTLRLLDEVPGTTVTEEMRLSNLSEEQRLNNFGGFSFSVDAESSGKTKGKKLTIYHETYNERHRERRAVQVLRVCWRTSKFIATECSVEVFDESSNWIEAFDSMMKKKNDLIRALLRQIAVQQSRGDLGTYRERLWGLRKECQRLGMKSLSESIAV